LNGIHWLSEDEISFFRKIMGFQVMV